jgi:hypothetical protein
MNRVIDEESVVKESYVARGDGRGHKRGEELPGECAGRVGEAML